MIQWSCNKHHVPPFPSLPTHVQEALLSPCVAVLVALLRDVPSARVAGLEGIPREAALLLAEVVAAGLVEEPGQGDVSLLPDTGHASALTAAVVADAATIVAGDLRALAQRRGPDIARKSSSAAVLRALATALAWLGPEDEAQGPSHRPSSRSVAGRPPASSPSRFHTARGADAGRTRDLLRARHTADDAVAALATETPGDIWQTTAGLGGPG